MRRYSIHLAIGLVFAGGALAAMSPPAAAAEGKKQIAGLDQGLRRGIQNNITCRLKSAVGPVPFEKLNTAVCFLDRPPAVVFWPKEKAIVTGDRRIGAIGDLHAHVGDAVESTRQRGGERQVRVGVGARDPTFDTERGTVTGEAIADHPETDRSIVGRPRNTGRRPRSGRSRRL